MSRPRRVERSGGTPVPRTDAWSRLRRHGARGLLALALAVLTYLLFPAAPVSDVPLFEVGAVASDDVIAPFAFTVPKSSSELSAERMALEAASPTVFRFVPAAADSSRRELDAFAGMLAAAARPGVDPRLMVPTTQATALRFGMRLEPVEAQYLSDPVRRDAVIGATRAVFDRWLTSGVAPTAALDSITGDVVLMRGRTEQRLASDSLATFAMLVGRARFLHPDPQSPIGDALFKLLLTRFFRPTLVQDVAATRLRLDELRRSIQPEKYEVRAGEKIIGANEVVEREDHEKLRALQERMQLRSGPTVAMRRVVGSLVFDVVLLVLLGLAIAFQWPRIYDDWRCLLLIAGTIAVVLGGAAVVTHIRPLHPELVPIALLGLVISALFDQRLSIVAVSLVTVLVGSQATFRGTNALYVALVGGVAAALTVREISRRNQSYYWIASVAAAYVAVSASVGLALDLPWRDVLGSVGWGALNALVSVLLALLVLPMAEHYTGIETDLTLLEWSDLNRPLMQRLSVEAPGTYAHTMVLANLAEAACRAIGANPLLARVGAYYHDIGKLAKPQYFVENQAKGRNPHDKLKPNTSASIIKNHIRDGLELAEQHRLPRALRAFITEHHGTGSITYFFEKAKEREGTPPNPIDYVYPGPVPQSAETAVVMLADGVEAAVRVLNEPTPQRVRDVVEHMVRQRIDQGQLRDTPLTLRQLEVVKEEFTRVLSGMYHNRVDYPAASGGVTSEFASV
ncbi:MAG TPA: HDIG domain-containing protein [Gemmatimonadaceae bacterium]|nr:HDIG domain-containing protein [Gemmatimonadaceae bacterium]